jgi:hypothetical protein
VGVAKCIVYFDVVKLIISEKELYKAIFLAVFGVDDIENGSSLF